MQKPYWCAAALGLGLALAPSAMSQVPAIQRGVPSVPATAIPPDQQASKEQVRRLFEVMGTRKQFQIAMSEIPAVIEQTVNITVVQAASKMTGGKQLNPQQLRAIEEVENRYFTNALKCYSADELLEGLEPVFQHRFSRSEVNALIAFYGSPPGQHLIDAQSATVQANLKKMPKLIEERLKPIMDAMERELNSDEMLNKLESLATAEDKPVQK
jgi:hypothetical protein